MIQLIRRFLNSENMPLNRILRTGLEEISNKIGGADKKTLFDVIGSLNTNLEKPLNELITDVKNTLYPGVLKHICSPSNNVLKTVLNTEKSTTVSGVSRLELASCYVSNIGGRIRVTASMKSNNTNGGAYLHIWVNDVEMYEVKVSGKTTYETVSKDFYVNPGDRLVFKMKSSQSGYTSFCNLITVCGDIESTTGQPEFIV